MMTIDQDINREDRGISIVGGGEDMTMDTGKERDRGDGVEKAELLDSGVCSGSQISACSVGKKR